MSLPHRAPAARAMAMASARISLLSMCLAASAATGSLAAVGQQAFLAPSSSVFAVPRNHQQLCKQHRARRRSITAASAAATSRMSAVASETAITDSAGGVETRTWRWKGYDIRYKVASEGSDGPPMVLVHGFGGNADHWRKNIPTLAETGPVYAIDLLGYGFSSKPDPGPWEERNSIYSFETWSEQLRDFVTEIVGRPVFMVCNSVGGVAGLQAGVDAPKQVLGVVLFNISLRMLHTKKQAPAGRPFVTGLQYVLRETQIGPLFFGSVAKPKAITNILKQCYGDPDQVTEELVEYILTPGLEAGAVKVFLDFISYSGGPLPEELLEAIKVPVTIAWGDQDPWEPVELGKELAAFDAVEGFVELPGAGHCPMDEAPHLTDPVVLDFVAKHFNKKISK